MIVASRKLSSILLILGLLVSILGVGVVAQSEKVNITFWTHTDPNRTELEKLYIEWFELLHPNVEIERVTNPSAKMQEQLLTAFASGQGPDIFNQEIQYEYRYILNDRVAPVDPEAIGYENQQAIYDEYLDGTLDPATYEGELYGLPLEVTNWAIYVNKKYFRDAGLDPEADAPETWEEMMEVSKEIVTRDGDALSRRAFDFRYPYYVTSLLPMVNQLGGKLIGEDGEDAIVNHDAWLRVLKYLKEWGPNGENLGSPEYEPARYRWNHDQNEAAMALSGLYQIGRLKNDNPKFFGSDDWKVIPYPRFEDAVNDVGSNIYGHFYMVNSQSSEEVQEWSWKFINFMLSHPEEYLLHVGLVQPKKSLMESDVFKSFPYADVFMEELEKSNYVPMSPHNSELNELIGDAVSSVMLSGTSPEKALENLDKEADKVLRD